MWYDVLIYFHYLMQQNFCFYKEALKANYKHKYDYNLYHN